jgi:drug/metabolite transporter (DMT)-like permease
VKNGYLTGLVSGVAWGLSGVVVGMAVAMAPFTGGRSLIAAPLAAAGLYDGLRTAWQSVPLLAGGHARQVLPSLRTRAGGYAVLAALVGGPLATSCYFLSLVFSGVTYAYAFSAISPALGATLAAMFLHERLPRRAWLGILLIIGGTVVVSYKAPAGASPHFYLGLVLGLVCALAWAFESLFAAKAMKQLDAIVVNVIRQGLSFLCFVVVILPLVPGAYGVFGRAFSSPSLAVLAGASAVGAAGYLLYFRAVHAVGPGRAMPINLTYVLWAALFSLMLTGTRPTLQLLIGALGILAGTPLVALERRRRRAGGKQPIAAVSFAAPAEAIAAEAAALQLRSDAEHPAPQTTAGLAAEEQLSAAHRLGSA